MELIYFLERNNFTKDQFDLTEYSWEDLLKIYNDHKENINLYKNISKQILDTLLNNDKNCKVYSIKERVKDPEHLLAKIIRKKLENNKRIIDINNYKKQITDLIGIRILHLFKADWIDIHEIILKEFFLKEKAIAYYRKGDEEKFINSYKNHDCETKKHDFGYRSVHYIVEKKESNKTYCCEIQVRTIFEDGWSEIDHKLRYSNNIKDQTLKKYLKILNRFSGSLDELSELIFSYINNLTDKESSQIKLKDELTFDPLNEEPSTLSSSTIYSILSPSSSAYFNEIYYDNNWPVVENNPEDDNDDKL